MDLKEKYDVRMWTGFIWLKTVLWWALVNMVMNLTNFLNS